MKKKWEIYYEITSALLAIFAVILAVLDIARGLNDWQTITDHFILVIFAIDYFVRFFISKEKKAFLKENILDLIAIIPFSSFFRAFRIARLAKIAKIAKLSKLSRLVAYSLRLASRTKLFLNTNGFKYVLVLSCILIILGGFTISFAEGMALPDAFWWAFVTATTVGYGDISPSTGAGRAIAIVLMVTGIGLIGTLTSTITSFFLNLNTKKLTPKEEMLHLVIHQLSEFDRLSDEDIEQICNILKTLKEKH